MKTLVEIDDPLTRAGVEDWLSGAADIDQVTDPLDADVAVLSTRAVDEELLLAIKHLRRTFALQVVLIVGSVNERDLLRISELGIRAVLLREEACSVELCESVRGAARGEGSMSPELLGLLLRAVETINPDGGEAQRGRVDGLTSREREVVRLLAKGYDTQDVAQAMSYSARTIKNVIHDATTRLNLRNRTHLVAFAIERGLL